ncbi:transglutaminase family protein [Paracoccus pacificus]|uniref:Transglutaminase domain-containing protein n=1 Tax=Paracoccus pacificus TaxID=1463598 RepID=A0ABW4R3K8_9RHOB
MLLRVTHETTYHYDHPVRNAVQSLRLRPSEFAGQKLLQWDVTIKDGIRGAAFRDGAGDHIEAWSVRGPVDSINVLVTGEVETTDLTGVLRGHREQVSPIYYLNTTDLTQPDEALTTLAQSVSAKDPLDLAHALSGAVSDAIAYVTGVTAPDTTAAQALSLGKGVCQDHAHALIALANVRDIPARYVSGYLHSTETGAQHDAAHAWAELHLPSLGWVAFDPANRSCADDRYIRLASGLDARDAAPVRGVFVGEAKETMTVHVAIGGTQQ